MVERRRELAARYQRVLSELPGFLTVRDPSYGKTNFQSFWVQLPGDYPLSRDELLRALADAGISARRGIMAAHREPAYEGHEHAPLPVTEAITDNSLILPLFHQMARDEQDAVLGS